MFMRSFKNISLFIIILVILIVICKRMKVEYSQTVFYHNSDTQQCATSRSVRDSICNKIIIIIAYGRSGSTFLGSLLKQTVRSFYLFEPNRAVKYLHKSEEDESLKFIDNNQFSWVNYHIEHSWKITANMQAFNMWINCNLSSMCIPKLFDSESTMFLNGCCRKEMLMKGTNRLIPKCLREEENYCKITTVKIFKFIRMKMKIVLQLLPIFPNMKVIHLVRDPRGIMNSKFGNKILPDRHGEMINHCKVLKDNLVYTKFILAQYPERIYILRYEDLAENPITIAKDVFKFASISFTPDIKNYLLNKTHATHDTCRHCVSRKNSSETAAKWREMLDIESTNYIYTACRLSNQVLGYLPLSNMSSLRNLHLQSRKVVNLRGNILSTEQL